MTNDPKDIRDQMKLCDKAVAALKRYHEARGKDSEAQVEKLRQEAERLFADVQTYIADSGRKKAD